MVTQPIANDTATDIFVDLDATSIALLLDVDGTLIDIAPSPNEVHASSDLQQSLARLLQLTGGALALVSGRPIADLDRLFAPLLLPAIGGHGGAVRRHSQAERQQEPRLRAHIAAGRAAFPGEATEVLPGKAMLEVKRPNVNKGDGVRALMRQPPFAGRMPVFICDHVTDESVFAALPELGGKGFSVSRHFAGLTGIFESPMHVRDALQRLASGAP